ncbi:hypothetical protein C8J32_11141 [Rhizobium sp. PP-CC-3A-592]|nr:hypothetical protein C8J32_11141 [Rhizobium sp. PP-CC-3A-592]
MTRVQLIKPSISAGELIASIKRMQGPGSAPDPALLMPNTGSLTVSGAGRTARAARRWTIFAGLVSTSTGIYLASEVHGFWGSVLCVIAAFMTLRAWTRRSVFKQELAEARSAWEKEVASWLDRGSPALFDRRKSELLETAVAYNELPVREHRKLVSLDQEKRRSQLERYLQQKLISGADIKGVGSGRVQKLASHGIVTAWDLHQRQVTHVSGIGPSLAEELQRWSREVERTFTFDETAPTDHTAIQRVKTEFGIQRDQLERELAKGQEELQRFCEEATMLRAQAPQPMVSAFIRLKQVETDISYIKGRDVRTLP